MQKYSRKSAEKSHIEQITTPIPDLAADCAPTTDKMSSFDIFAFKSSDLSDSGEECHPLSPFGLRALKSMDRNAHYGVEFYVQRSKMD
jgi:hypothetical protein